MTVVRKGKKVVEKATMPVSELVNITKSHNAQLEAMSKIVAKMEGWQPARKILREVQSVETEFTQFDGGTRVGGLPIGRITTIHGPSNQGKTIFMMGLMLSFLKGNHFVAHIDTEMTTPITWCEKLMGAYADHPGYMAMRPKSFEEANDGVRACLTNFGEAKVKGLIPPTTSLIMGLDSLRKLVPLGLMSKLLKDGMKKHGADGMRGRGAQTRAALVAQWLDELVPLLADTGAALVIVARESEDPDADANDKLYGRDYIVGGGKSIIYDASIVARIERAKWVYQGTEDDKNVIGERLRVRIWKTKVGGKDDKTIDTFFHTSNGTFIPEGFDRARDILELARNMEIVKTEGSWLHWAGRKWQGENQAVKKLTSEPEVLAELEKLVRAGFVLEGDSGIRE
jgi:RecA/RadA recombinase